MPVVSTLPVESRRAWTASSNAGVTRTAEIAAASAARISAMRVWMFTDSQARTDRAESFRRAFPDAFATSLAPADEQAGVRNPRPRLELLSPKTDRDLHGDFDWHTIQERLVELPLADGFDGRVRINRVRRRNSVDLLDGPIRRDARVQVHGLFALGVRYTDRKDRTHIPNLDRRPD